MVNTRKLIGVITTTRADYGLLRYIIKAIQESSCLELYLIVSGTHLIAEYGNTIDEIEADGFPINAKLKLEMTAGSDFEIAYTAGKATVAFCECYNAANLDMLIILGDRFEILAAAQSALLMKIPIIHIHGGEITEGALDESARHAISKMANLHITSNDTHRQRLLHMGEIPERVFAFGAPGLDNFVKLELADQQEIERYLDLEFTSPLFLVCYHPATLNHLQADVAIDALLTALSFFTEACIVFTLPNADAGGSLLRQKIKTFVEKHPERMRAVASLGTRNYLGLMKLANVMIGNSSSGILEAPSVKLPTVNIGDRQKGRVRAKSVIDCIEESEAIKVAINVALSKQFRQSLVNMKNPYGEAGNIATKIVKCIEEIKTPKALLRKPFFEAMSLQE